MGFSWVFGQEIGEKWERAGNLMISGKSENNGGLRGFLRENEG